MSFIGINKRGYPYILVPATIAAVFGHFKKKRVALSSAVASLASVWFFRDPDRYPPYDRELIVSPADGRITSIRQLKEKEWLETDVYRISIFMSILDVHVNRAPVTGRVLEIKHQPGIFISANKVQASERNEKRIYFIERLDGLRMLMVQVAGLIARRTVSFVNPGDEILAGERLGMIQFGSRLDLFVPVEGAKLLVNIGHKVRAGETPLFWALWRSKNE